MNTRGICLALACVWLAVAALADRGSIPFNPKVTIFEPNQRAMIAWNGTEEIMLLSTDLRASGETKVLEVMPFPDKPIVSKGDVATFARANELINKKLPKPNAVKGPHRATREASAPAGEVVSHQVIGAHDITVTRVLDHKGFITWAEDYLKGQGVESPKIPDMMKTTVAEYLKEGFRWFVFDTISLGEKTITNDAIQYRFKCDYLYYPLKISRTDTGNTTIDLLVLTTHLLGDFRGISYDAVKLRHQPVTLTAAELKGLNPDMAALFNHRDGLKLRIWRIQGDLKSFDKDLIAKPRKR